MGVTVAIVGVAPISEPPNVPVEPPMVAPGEPNVANTLLPAPALPVATLGAMTGGAALGVLLDELVLVAAWVVLTVVAVVVVTTCCTAACTGV